jgi:predicted dehydrogenase
MFHREERHMSDHKLRVGVIGIGGFASIVHVPNLRKTGRAEIAAICRRNPKRLAGLKEELGVERAYTDWRQMLADVELEAVIVSTPHNAHTAPTLAALERGLHVLVEKPMALTSEDARAMVTAAEREERVLTVGCSSRGDSIWRTARRKLQEGLIGTLRQISVSLVTNIDLEVHPEKSAPSAVFAILSSLGGGYRYTAEDMVSGSLALKPG